MALNSNERLFVLQAFQIEEERLGRINDHISKNVFFPAKDEDDARNVSNVFPPGTRFNLEAGVFTTRAENVQAD